MILENLFESCSVGLVGLSGFQECDSEKCFEELSVVEAILDVQGVFNGHGEALNLRNTSHDLNDVLGCLCQIHNLEEVEEALEYNLLVGWVLVVLLEEVRVVEEILLDLEMVDGQERHGLIEIFGFLKKAL